AALKPYADAADLIRLNLFTALGRAADEARTGKLADTVVPRVGFAAFGVAGFEWPRAEVVSRAAGVVARAVLKVWVAPDLKRAREAVPAWAATRWAQLGLDADTLMTHLRQAAEAAAGARIEEQVEL